MKRSSLTSEIQQSTPQRPLTECQRQRVADEPCSTPATRVECKPVSLKTPTTNKGASCRKFKLGCRPAPYDTGGRDRSANVRSPSDARSGYRLTPQSARSGTSQPTADCSEIPANALHCQKSALSCKSTSSYVSGHISSTPNVVPQPSKSISGQRSAHFLNTPLVDNPNDAARLQSRPDATSCFKSKSDVSQQSPESVSGQQSTISSSTVGTSCQNSSLSAKLTPNNAVSCSKSKQAALSINPPKTHVTKQSAHCSKSPPLVGAKNSSDVTLAEKRTPKGAPRISQLWPNVTQQPTKSFGNQQSASRSPTKSPVKSPRRSKSGQDAKPMSKYTAGCLNYSAVSAMLTPLKDIASYKSAAIAKPPVYYNSRPHADTASTRSNQSTLSADSSICKNTAKSECDAAIAKAPVYYNSRPYTDTESASKRCDKSTLSADSVHNNTAKPERDATTKVISLQPNSGITKKKKKKKNKTISTATMAASQQVTNVPLELCNMKVLTNAGQVNKTGMFASTFAPSSTDGSVEKPCNVDQFYQSGTFAHTFTPSSTNDLHHASPALISEEDMEIGDTVNEVILALMTLSAMCNITIDYTVSNVILALMTLSAMCNISIDDIVSSILIALITLFVM